MSNNHTDNIKKTTNQLMKVSLVPSKLFIFAFFIAAFLRIEGYISVGWEWIWAILAVPVVVPTGIALLLIAIWLTLMCIVIVPTTVIGAFVALYKLIFNK